MRCVSCGFENPEGIKFCGQCAAPIQPPCPQCGFANPPGFKFCGACAVPLSRQPARVQPAGAVPQVMMPARVEAERRQLTVMFIDLVGSTTLSQQLDPEDYHTRVVAYQTACHRIIARYEGHVAQYLGDGVLVYFGYPTAHEDDAVRAVRSGVEIVTAVRQLAYSPPLHVRIGIHTGPVVVGAIGVGEHTARLALGETPNLAARVQGIAEPDAVVVSAATYRLVHGLFECHDLGVQALKGITAPVSVYRVMGESDAQSRFEVTVRTGLTPLVGRESELGLLRTHWEQAKAGTGQGVLVSGEPGIGKSRLVQALKEHVTAEGATCIEFRCSPYHQNSAFYPIINHLQRLLQLAPHDTPQAKLSKLQQMLARYRFPQTDTLSLLAALLSLPQPESVPSLTLSPQKQKQKTQEALVAWLLEEAEKATVYCIWEDLHWADPSTLEVLSLLLDHVPTTRLLTVLTFRPEFVPPWRLRSHITQLMLSRLGQKQVEVMVEKVTHGQALPPEVLQQIVTKTDGVPLFVEELTKSVVEAVEAHGGMPLQTIAIPATLQDSLMARLDRLGPAKEVAQLGATIGREFSYELLHAVSPLPGTTVQESLAKLVDAKLLYQRGLLPQATYTFKHALIQDAAYQSLLKSTRQQYHRQIAQILEERFAETKDTQPELLAHHYTEAGFIAQAIPYWQQAGQKASQRSAHAEAINHLTKGLELLKTMPDAPERTQQELALQITLAASLQAPRGYGASEVEKVYARARELCQQIGESSQLFFVLIGLAGFYVARGEFETARGLGEQLLTLAQKVRRPLFFLWVHYLLGEILFYLGELVSARNHLEHSLTFYDPQRRHSYRGPHDPSIACLTNKALASWCAGYPDQALEEIHAASALARELTLPFSLARAVSFTAVIHRIRREEQAAQEQAEAVISLCTEQGIALYLEHGTVIWGSALVEQGRMEEGVARLRHGLVLYQVTGAELWRPFLLSLLAEAYGKAGQREAGFAILDEAMNVVNKNEERWWEAELYRLKGELLLQPSRVGIASQNESLIEAISVGIAHPTKEDEAEACFLKAIAIARQQQAKSLELRAAISLARLWQQHGKQHEAHKLLSYIYHWFTEGFDTKDLQEAKALLDALAEGV